MTPAGPLYRDMTEFYDLSYTKFGCIGSSGRSLSINSDRNPQAFTTTADVTDIQAQNIAVGWRNVMGNKAAFPEMLDFQWSHETAVMRGKPDGGGSWQDCIHFSAWSPHGFQYLGEIYANQIMRILGMITFGIPRITESNWTPTHIDVWHPDYGITTRGQAFDGTVSPFVRGSAFDGQLLTTEAQLIADAGGSGRVGVRITPAGGVDGSEVLTYGVGAQPGFMQFPDDYQNTYVLDLPVMDVGQVGAPAMPVEPRQLNNAFTSNLVGTPFITATSARGCVVEISLYRMPRRPHHIW